MGETRRFPVILVVIVVSKKQEYMKERKM